MTSDTYTAFTIAQLFADLEKDGITVETDTIKKLEKGDIAPIKKIGYEYDANKQKYNKAMAWYRLAAVQNDPWSQNSIGNLYYNGEGVPQDYFMAMEWYLKAAIGNDKTANENIALCFQKGCGVPLSEYKALEWYHKSGNKPDKIKELAKNGIQLIEEDKNKSIKQLILETENIFWQKRKDDENELIQENKKLRQSKTRVGEESLVKDHEINPLTEEAQTSRHKSSHNQQEACNHHKMINQYRREVERMNSEIQSLKAINTTQSAQLEVKAIHLNTLEREIVSLRIASERPIEVSTKRLEEVERSNQNLEKLLEQERRLKENEIALMKQEMEASLNEGKNLKRKFETESQAIQNELKRLKSSVRLNGSAGINDTDNSATEDIEKQGLKKDNESDENGNNFNEASVKKIKIESV